MNKSIDIKDIQAEFMGLWCIKVQDLSALRRSKMSQRQMAALTGRSLKTIQRFEKYKCFDPELMYIHSKAL